MDAHSSAMARDPAGEPWWSNAEALAGARRIGGAERLPRTAVWLQISGIDAAIAARMPNLDALRRRGTWSRRAVEAGRHGVAADDPLPVVYRAARFAGLQTALVAGERRARQWMTPECLDHFSFPGASPWAVAQETASLLWNVRPDLCGAQFSAPETAACRYGWGSAQHRAALETCDATLAAILNALDRIAPPGETLLVVTARRGVLPEGPAAPGLPWIGVGPGLPVGREIDAVITAADTAALLIRVLALPVLSLASSLPLRQQFSLAPRR